MLYAQVYIVWTALISACILIWYVCDVAKVSEIRLKRRDTWRFQIERHTITLNRIQNAAQTNHTYILVRTNEWASKQASEQTTNSKIIFVILLFFYFYLCDILWHNLLHIIWRPLLYALRRRRWKWEGETCTNSYSGTSTPTLAILNREEEEKKTPHIECVRCLVAFRFGSSIANDWPTRVPPVCICANAIYNSHEYELCCTVCACFALLCFSMHYTFSIRSMAYVVAVVFIFLYRCSVSLLTYSSVRLVDGRHQLTNFLLYVSRIVFSLVYYFVFDVFFLSHSCMRLRSFSLFASLVVVVRFIV